MSKSVLLAAAAALLFTACGDETPDIAGGEGIETMKTVSAIVVAPVGPGDRDAEFVVEVTHDPGLDPEAAQRLFENIRVVRIPESDISRHDDFDAERAFGADVYWHDGQPFAVDVTVDAIDEDLEDEMYRFEWINIAELFEHCPEGQHWL